MSLHVSPLAQPALHLRVPEGQLPSKAECQVYGSFAENIFLVNVFLDDCSMEEVEMGVLSTAVSDL